MEPQYANLRRFGFYLALINIKLIRQKLNQEQQMVAENIIV